MDHSQVTCKGHPDSGSPSLDWPFSMWHRVRAAVPDQTNGHRSLSSCEQYLPEPSGPYGTVDMENTSWGNASAHARLKKQTKKTKKPRCSLWCWCLERTGGAGWVRAPCSESAEQSRRWWNKLESRQAKHTELKLIKGYISDKYVGCNSAD